MAPAGDARLAQSLNEFSRHSGSGHFNNRISHQKR